MASCEIVAQLGNWAVADNRGVTLVAGGFVLPSGARRAADVSWISRKQLEAFRLQVNRRSMVLFSISRERGTRLQAEVLVDGSPRRLRRN